MAGAFHVEAASGAKIKIYPKPGTTAPAVPKVSFVTRVGDLGCGVGYYR
jgi:hypothetical protein